LLISWGSYGNSIAAEIKWVKEVEGVAGQYSNTTASEGNKAPRKLELRYTYQS